MFKGWLKGICQRYFYLHTCVLQLFQAYLAAMGTAGSLAAGHHNYQAPGAAV
jgi:hypothetical protein